MADNQINIKIGSEVSGALSGLQKVQTQMAQTAKSSQTFTQALSKVPQTSGAATQSLINLSRVAQDAPFGFIGIANNLNPLLESFQRLRATAGTTGGALKALGASLLGPAGIGLALGVTSSLLITFGDRLFGAGKKAKDAAKEIKSAFDIVNSATDSVQGDIAKVNALVQAATNSSNSFKIQSAAISELKKLSKEFFGGLEAGKSSFDQITAAANAYTQSLVNQAIVKGLQDEITELSKQIRVATKEYNNATKAADAARRARDDASYKGEIQGIAAVNNQLAKAQQNYNNYSGALIKAGLNVGKLNTQFKELVTELQKQVGLTLNLDTLKTPDVKPVKVKDVKFEIDRAEFTVRQFDVIIPEEVKGRFSKEVTDLFSKAQSNLKSLKPSFDASALSEGFKKAQKEAQIFYENTLNAANLISGTLAPAFTGLFEAITSGGDALKGFFESLKQSINQLIQRLIAAAIQAAILSALTRGTGNPLSFLNAFKSVLGFRATGGPVGANSPYVVGERGPELFVPSVNGNIIPNNRLNSFTGNTVAGGGEVIFRIGGNELVGVLSRANQSQRRLA